MNNLGLLDQELVLPPLVYEDMDMTPDIELVTNDEDAKSELRRSIRDDSFVASEKKDDAPVAPSQSPIAVIPSYADLHADKEEAPAKEPRRVHFADEVEEFEIPTHDDDEEDNDDDDDYDEEEEDDNDDDDDDDDDDYEEEEHDEEEDEEDENENENENEEDTSELRRRLSRMRFHMSSLHQLQRICETETDYFDHEDQKQVKSEIAETQRTMDELLRREIEAHREQTRDYLQHVVDQRASLLQSAFEEGIDASSKLYIYFVEKQRDLVKKIDRV